MLILLIFLLIIAMLIQAFVSVVLKIAYKIKINRLLDSINTKDDLLYLRTKEFEYVIAEIFKRKGYKVDITDKFGEGGNGLVLNGIEYVQIKKYPYHHVIEIEAAKKLVKYMQDDYIYRGMIITLGGFKNNTKNFCHKNVINCVNGDQLLSMCKEVQGIPGDMSTLILRIIR